MVWTQAKQQSKTAITMGLESITDTESFGLIKWFGFFGASFVPSFFLAAYFLGGYYPGLAVGASTEPSWWPTAMQYAHGVPKAVLAQNSAALEAKEKAAEEARQKAEVSFPFGVGALVDRARWSRCHWSVSCVAFCLCC